ncbi:MAG: hypothetical protein K5930_01400 [Treponemataceae bacterium]|nr:hypothetical protein [Treponemataceae bacterium]
MKDSDSRIFSFAEGLRVEIPCVETAVFFSQEIKDKDESDSSFFTYIPENWGIRVSAPPEGKSPYALGCDFGMGRVSVSGPLSELKNPLPSIKRKWNTSTYNSLKLRVGLPSIADNKKPLSFFTAVDSKAFYTGFAVISLDEGERVNASGLGAEAMVFQLCFSKEGENGFSFSNAGTFSLSGFDEVKSSSWFSLKSVRPPATRRAFLNETLISGKGEALSVSFQNSFSAGISDFKAGIFLYDNALLCLSVKKTALSLGFFLSDFGFLTYSGNEIFDVFRLYGSFSSSFKLSDVTVETDFSCMTGLSFDDDFPFFAEPVFNYLSTDAMGGVSACYEGFSFALDCSVKKLCRQKDFSDSVFELGVELGAKGASVKYEGKMPLFYVENSMDWAFTLEYSGEKGSFLAAALSSRFKNFDFTQAKGSLTFSYKVLKSSVSMSLSSERKLSWTCSISVSL